MPFFPHSCWSSPDTHTYSAFLIAARMSVRVIAIKSVCHVYYVSLSPIILALLSQPTYLTICAKRTCVSLASLSPFRKLPTQLWEQSINLGKIVPTCQLKDLGHFVLLKESFLGLLHPHLRDCQTDDLDQWVMCPFLAKSTRIGMLPLRHNRYTILKRR